MKISLNWLKEYIDIRSNPDELEEILTSLGLEVEGMEEVQSIPGGLAGLVIGKVTSCGKHPNADRLSVTTVDIGEAEDLHIVCGAPNVAKGQKVVVAPVNTQLYPTKGEPFLIKKGKIRGEVSEGMICAEDEIGLGEEHEGIIVLDDSAKVGTAAAEYFNIETDTIYDIGLTPNRSDATSHIGVARDLVAFYKYYGHPDISLKFPDTTIDTNLRNEKKVNVQIRDLQGCPRFSGVILSDLKIGPSPEWMQRRLRSIGVRPISNVVDITNYVLHEFGQPLHAYDLEKIAGQSIHVQTLPEGSTFLSLDEKERILSSEDLIICDGHDQGMCIAGVFGGLKSGVTDQTTDIFLESAHFNALQLRRTSTRHQLRTDAAKCFEKGTDPAQTITALKRAANLLCQYAGATIASQVIDEYPDPIKPLEIKIRRARVNLIIGANLSSEELLKIFDALAMPVLQHDREEFTVSVPTNKADVIREIDVIEEVLRIYGFNNVTIPEKLSSTIANTERIDKVRLRKKIAEVLTNKGFNEMMSLSLIPSAIYDSFEEYTDRLVTINNTSNVHLDILRPEMMFSALLNARYNTNRQQKDLALFENGKTYLKNDTSFEETEWITLLHTGACYNQTWRPPSRNKDIYDIKVAVLSILDRLGVQNYQVSELEDARFQYGLQYQQGKNILGRLGRVSAKAKKATDLDQEVFYAELNMDLLLKRTKKAKIQIAEIPRYPSSRRDLALILKEQVTYDQVETIIRKNGSSLLKEVHLFDIYRDKKNLGEGLKSYAVSLTFEDEEKSLKDKVVDKFVNKIVLHLESELDAKLR